MALQAPLLGGLFIGVLSALPVVSLGNCCCLWVVGGGLLAAYLDQQNDPRPTTPGRGAMAGLLAGVIGAVVWLALDVVLDTALASFQERTLEESLSRMQDIPPEMREFLAVMSGPAGILVGFLVQLVLGAIFATLGGLLGAALFKSDAPPALDGPPAPPPLQPQ